MRPIDLPVLAKQLDDFARERDWDKFHSPKNLAMALSVEASELLEIFQWLTEEEVAQMQRDPQLMKRTEEEIADVFVYLVRMLQKTGIDLQAAVERKMIQNALKYPVELAFGSAKKYDELK